MTPGLNRRGLNSECKSGQFAVVLCGFAHSVNSGVLYLLVMATCSIKRRARSGVWFGGNMDEGIAEVEGDALRCRLHSNVAGIPCLLTYCMPNKLVSCIVSRTAHVAYSFWNSSFSLVGNGELTHEKLKQHRLVFLPNYDQNHFYDSLMYNWGKWHPCH